MDSSAALKVTVIEDGKPPKMHSFERFPIAVGRAASNDIALHGWKVARVHAEIHQLGTGFKLIDRGSLSGTWVNSQRIVEYGPLTDTDEVVICGFVLKVQVPLPHFAKSAPVENVHAVQVQAPQPAPSPQPQVAASPAA